MTVALKTRKPKTVDIISRVSFKDASRSAYVVYAVRSSNGVDVYQVTLVNGHPSGCTCVSRKPCYHMAGCEKNESERATDLQQHLTDEKRVYSCPGCGTPNKDGAYCYRCNN